MEGLTHKDFDVFTIDGLDERMEALIEHVRPKLEMIGQTFAPTLSVMTGEEMYMHVAKHARRTVNPPDDSWVAFAPSKRGYKKLPHFQVGLWETHMFIWFALVYEAPLKQPFAEQFDAVKDDILENIPDDFVWSVDHTKPDVITNDDLTDERLQQIIERLKTVKKAEFLCGVTIPREEAVQLSGDELEKKIHTTFETLMPLYQLTKTHSS